MIEFAPPLKLWVPQRPAIIRAASMEEVERSKPWRGILPGTAPVIAAGKTRALIPGSIITNGADQSSYTLTDVPVAALGPNRGFGIVFSTVQAGALDLSGVTIGGVAADFVDYARYGTSSDQIVGVAWSEFPSGTDADWVVSLSATAQRFVARPFTTYGYVPDTVFEDGAAQNLSVSAAVAAGGAVIAVAGTNIVSGSISMGGLSETSGSNTWEVANSQYQFGSEGPMSAQTKNITITGSGAPAGNRAGLLALTFEIG